MSVVHIGPYSLRNNVVLAPMAGVTDLPFRELAWDMGAGLVVSEMVTSRPDLQRSAKTRQRRAHVVEAEPRAVQIAGGDAADMAAAARLNVAEGAQLIDINMGCPAKKVCRKAAGSALLADEALVADILTTVVAAVDVPVTLKIRTGPTPQQRNAVTIARIAEDAGIAALAVHGRTRADRFNGHAEYDTIAAVVAAVDLPVFANGDITDAATAARVLAWTGAAGVMIGRAAQGRPWLLGQIAHHLATGGHLPDPAPADVQAIVLGHLERLHAFYGPRQGVRIARKHLGWALADLPGGEPVRRWLNRIDDAGAQRAAVAGLDFADLAAARLASAA